MDFGFTQQEEDFRKEVREFIKKEFPAERRWHFRTTLAASIFGLKEKEWQFMQTMARKLGEKGWLSLSWPKEYGGRESMILQLIVYEEMLYYNCPGIYPVGTTFLAPTLLEFGSEEQKKTYLPGIASGEVSWTELLSEPDSGSDLASLKTLAIEDGDDYVINGQKIWNSGAHRADWAFILVRTDPDSVRHRGLSYFLMDMKTPGITVNPIINMTGEHEFNEVFLDEVRVPKENIVGGLNKGWYVTMATLDHERAAHMLYPAIRSNLEHVAEYVNQTDKPLDLLQRNRLAELLAECEMARMMHYRAVWMMEKGGSPTYEVAIDKMYNCELARRAADFCVQALGSYGGLVEGSKLARLNGWAAFYYLDSTSYPIMGGTSEIDKNVIATRGLGLPTE